MGTCTYTKILTQNKMDDSSQRLLDIHAPVSAPGGCDDLQPQTALSGDIKEADERLQIDSIGAADSRPEQDNAGVQSVIPEFENNVSPTDLYSKHPPTTVEASENNRMMAAQVDGDEGVHGGLDHAEHHIDDEICQQFADDVPLIDLSANVEDGPLIQTPPTDLEIQQSTFADHEDNTRLMNTTQAEIFSKIYTTAASHDQDNDDKKNCCNIACGKACYTDNNEGCRMRPLLTESLIHGRDVGWTIFRSIVFPLVSVINRRVWIASLWLPAVILVCLALATIIANGTEIPYIIGILLCGIFVVYCVVDTLGTEICHFQLSDKNANLYTRHVVHEDDNGGDEQAINRIKKWQKMTNLLDFLRLIVPELALFPIVVCDLYSLVVYRSYTGQPAVHLISFIKLLVSCIALIIHSHVVRLAVIATTAHRLHTQRTPPVELLQPDNPSNGASQQIVFDSTLRQAGLCYWKVFVAHVVLQILNQALLIIALGFKLQDYLTWTEAFNYDPNLYFNKKSTIKVELAFFMVGSYFLPICGFWLFFVVTHYWLHEFLIGLTVDFVSMLQLPGANQHFFPLDVDNGDEKITKILEYVDFDNLKHDYTELHMIQTFIDKGCYPFRNYVLTLLCTAYLMLQIIYLSFALLDIKNRDTVTAVIYVIAVIGEVVSSFSAFLVGVFWILFFSIVLLLLCGMCLKQCESPTHHNYTVRPYNSYPVQRPYFTTVPQHTPTRNQPVTAAHRQPFQQPYFTTRPQRTPGLNQPVRAGCRQPTSDNYYPNFVASGWPTAGRGQIAVRQNAPPTYTANPSWVI